jgi:heterotetrameric sarcosine oxidase gamma subunit
VTDQPVPVRITPINAWAQNRGARFANHAGWRCANGYAALEAETVAARDRVALADLSSQGKLQVEGEQAAGLIGAALGGAPEKMGGGWTAPSGHVYRLRPDLFLVVTVPGGESATHAQLLAAQSGALGLVTVTDLTHGLAALCLLGPASRAVLRKACALDLSPDAFPDLSARATSTARTRHVIVRRDLGALPAFTLFGAPSLAAYVWDVLLEAGRSEGIVPIGLAAVYALEAAAR